MAKEQEPEEVMAWPRKNPEPLEKLDRMRRIEEDGPDTGIDRIELEMPELVKSIGATSFGRRVQGKQAKAMESAKAGGGCRIHGKKN